MKIKILLHFLFFGLTLNSCNFVKKNIEEDAAIQYSNKIMEHNDLLTKLFKKTNEEKLSEVEYKVLTQNFLNGCDSSIAKLAKMKPFIDDSSLKNGMITYIENFKLIIKKDGHAIDSIFFSKGKLSESQNDEIFKLGKELNKKLRQEQNKFNQIHLSFVKRHEDIIQD